MYQELNIEEWPRRSTYEFLKDYEDPFFNFAANLDVTALYRFLQGERAQFFSDRPVLLARRGK
mgnify:CR=1 FL=1